MFGRKRVEQAVYDTEVETIDPTGCSVLWRGSWVDRDDLTAEEAIAMVNRSVVRQQPGVRIRETRVRAH